MVKYNDYVAMNRVVIFPGNKLTNAYHSHLVVAVDYKHAQSQAQAQAKSMGHQLISVRRIK